MTVRPIIFSAPMVRALLAGSKTMTRRTLKPQPVRNEAGLWTLDLGRRGFSQTDDVPATMRERGWLRFAPGDLLWVRETWQTGMGSDGPQISYRATPDYCDIDAWDGPDEGAGPSFNYDRCPGATWHTNLSDLLSGEDGAWRPGIHMPRWASRLTLAVTAVKVERLQNISEEDALAEGVETDAWDMAPVARRYGTEGWFVGWPMGVSEPNVSVDDGEVCRRSFASLWNSINGAGAWEANPWVLAITFTVHRANVDALAKAEAA